MRIGSFASVRFSGALPAWPQEAPSPPTTRLGPQLVKSEPSSKIKLLDKEETGQLLFRLGEHFTAWPFQQSGDESKAIAHGRMQRILEQLENAPPDYQDQIAAARKRFDALA